MSFVERSSLSQRVPKYTVYIHLRDVPIHDTLQLRGVSGVEGEREEVVELLPVVQSLGIVYGQVQFHLWTTHTQTQHKPRLA